jgi:hypothetical protein
MTDTVAEGIASLLKTVTVGGGISLFVGLIYAFVRYA